MDNRTRLYMALDRLRLPFRVGLGVDTILGALDAESTDECQAGILRGIGLIRDADSVEVQDIALPDSTEPVRVVPVATAPEKPRKAAKTAKAAAKPKGHKRANPALRSKACAECGETKGVTGFPSGSDVCRLCSGIVSPLKNSRRAAKHDGDTVGARRRCEKCGEMKPLDRFPGEGRRCSVCLATRKVAVGGNGAEG